MQTILNISESLHRSISLPSKYVLLHVGQDKYTVFGSEVDAEISEIRFVDGMVVILKKLSDPDWNRYPYGVVFGNESVAKADERIKSELPIP